MKITLSLPCLVLLGAVAARDDHIDQISSSHQDEVHPIGTHEEGHKDEPILNPLGTNEDEEIILRPLPIGEIILSPLGIFQDEAIIDQPLPLGEIILNPLGTLQDEAVKD